METTFRNSFDYFLTFQSHAEWWYVKNDSTIFCNLSAVSKIRLVLRSHWLSITSLIGPSETAIMYHLGEGTRPSPFVIMANGYGRVTEPVSLSLDLNLFGDKANCKNRTWKVHSVIPALAWQYQYRYSVSYLFN